MAAWRTEGDMGRYVAINDPGQPGAGYDSYEAYQAAVQAGQAKPSTSYMTASTVGPQPGIVSTPLLTELAYKPAGSLTSDEANVNQPEAQPILGNVTNADVKPAKIVAVDINGNPTNVPPPIVDIGPDFELDPNLLLNTQRGSTNMSNQTQNGTTNSDPAIGADPAILDKIKEQAGVVPGTTPTLPTGTKVTGTKITEEPDEILGAQDQLEDIDVTAAKAPTTGLEVTAPTKPTYKGVETSTTVPGVTALGPAEAAYGEVSPEAVIGDIKGEVSTGAIATAATADLDEKATMTYQLGELYKSLEAGKPLPAWAAPAARAANAVMLQRGLGASSMAAAASVQALMESATPIAAADAQKYATIQLQNLNNEQQVALQNAATYAAMDRANLDARMTAAVNNARTFLAIDTQNLTNEQASNTLTYNAKLQSLFTDAAAENATAQFNAKNQAQVDQFFAELGAQVSAANKNRVAAQEQFNVDQENAMAQFVEQANNQRQQFNVNMQAQIDQSNALWRREINTVNTAIDNEVNRINAQNLLGMTTASQNALWQKYRDEATWVFQMAENEAQRIHQFGIAAMEADANADMYDQETMNKFAQMLGGQALKSIFNYFTD